MEAVILAGGQGTRLRPHTDEIPKPLLPVEGRPVVEILLKQMQRTGVEHVYMAVNHLSELIIETIGDGRKYGLKIEYSREKQPLSTVGPLKLIKNLPESFIVANADILTDLNFNDLFQTHLKNKAKLTVATYDRTNPIDFGVLTVDDSGMAVGFNEKPVFNFTVSMGIYVFSKSILDFVPSNKSFGFDKLMFTLFDNHIPVHTYPYNGYWLDIGRIDDYLKANEDIKRVSDLIS
jgi:NDP-sugar pyrophosphorylase family protein